MEGQGMNKKVMIATGLAGVALVGILAESQNAASIGDAAFIGVELNGPDQDIMVDAAQIPVNGSRAATMPAEATAGGNSGQDGALQALEGLAQIRQQQCQSGNQLACQVIPTIPGVRAQLTQLGQSCGSGESQACGSYRSLSQRIFTAYFESAAVMRQGDEAMAQMNSWRNQMNANAAASMANLQATGARGQAAHAAQQEAYAAMNDTWAAGQASGERTQGRFIDGIYEGTTMSGGGVQARIGYGQTGYIDGYGNVITGPEGSNAPTGYEEMTPTYATPD